MMCLYLNVVYYRLWKKEKRHGGFIPSISLDKVIEIHKAEFIRWQVHKDWVQQVSLLFRFNT